MRKRTKFPFTALTVTRNCNIAVKEIAGPCGSWRDGAMDSTGRFWPWADLHATHADAITAARKLLAEAEEKVERLQALQDVRRANIDAATERTQAREKKQ